MRSAAALLEPVNLRVIVRYAKVIGERGPVPTWDRQLLYLFEDFAVDTDHRELRRGPTIVPIAPLACDLLEFLIRFQRGGFP
jgi:hypothetical protein